jgi:hypothetical protein
VETQEDIKFIWNGRVLHSTEDVRRVCAEYFGEDGGGNGAAGDEGRKEDLVLILHAVVRPPDAPMKRKGKKKVDSGPGVQMAGSRDVVCSCCVVQ